MSNFAQKYYQRTNHNIFLFNLILWCSAFGILLYLFSQNDEISKIDYIYTGSFISTIIVPVCINLYILIPTFLKKEKYLLFGVLFIVNLLLFTQLNIWFFDVVIDSIFTNYYFISYHSNVKVFFIFFIFLVFTTLIKLSEDWLYLNQIENTVLKTQKKEIELQLSTLKAQINPHFLFNSLNVLYSLSIDKKEEITNAILQLSDILRYVIYEVETGKITIKKEIELIKNYIEFEKKRHIKNAKIDFNFTIDKDLEIYPMLLLPLLENSFKHGLKSGVKNPFIDINLSLKNKKLDFKIFNNFKEIENSSLNENKGIGLKNIQENLMIIYPNKHQFTTKNKEHIFSVNLTLDL